ncbi:MAG: PLP-dependent transferase [Terrimicrobiaceae bacterium]
MIHPLHSKPLCRAEDLGMPIPASPHAVSVCLPTWADILGYEEKEPRVIDRMRTGYPRFFLHPLIKRVCAELNTGPGCETLPFANEAAARECAAITKGEARNIDGLWAAFFSDNSLQTARAYWQHAGRILSSRAAEDWLATRHLAPPSPALELRMRTRLSEWSGIPVEKINLHPSGMAAIFGAFQLVTARRPGRRTAMFGFPYTDTLKILQKFGPGVEFFPQGDAGDLAKLAALMEREEFAGIFCEVPSNPLLKTPNLVALAELGRRFGTPIIVDDTIGTALNVDVTPHADLVATSLTKAVSGEGDVMAGALSFCSRLPDLTAPSPQSGGLYARDLEVLEKNSRDFPGRLSACNANALTLARFLESHPAIEAVWYPGLAPSPAYESLRKPGGGHGAVLSFLPINARENTPRIYEKLSVSRGISLGTTYTLVSPYVQLAHYHELDWARACGIDPHLLRVAVGAEDPAELLARFESALG